jgi:hypothetical protein
MQHRRENIDGIVLVTEDAEHLLNQRQLTDYKEHRRTLIKWMLNLGKDPKKAEGYAWDTVRQRAYKLDQFCSIENGRRRRDYSVMNLRKRGREVDYGSRASRPR